jgi:lauroyl/myristoyl acyltransferase
MKNKLFYNARHWAATAGAWGFEMTAFIASCLPRSWRYPFAGFLGRTVGTLSPNMRDALRLNLNHLFKLSKSELDQNTKAIFYNFGLTLYDFFFPEGLTIDVPDKEKLTQLREKHGGILVLTFHMGHWELGARTMQQWGWPVTAVYQPYQNKKFKQVIEKRRAQGVNFIAVGTNAASGVREALRRGEMVAMLGDHPFGEEGMPVHLLGHKVIWPKGPVVLAVRENAPIVVAVIVRVGPRHYRAIIEEALIPKSKSRAEVERLVQEVANKFGKLLPQYLTQWYRLRPLEFVEK